ncbi:MAG: hypothetical protein M3P08_11865 [Thermoproteota archaeon]|nr:hypothetical protein [Thermoproteota archaeon]
MASIDILIIRMKSLLISHRLSNYEFFVLCLSRLSEIIQHAQSFAPGNIIRLGVADVSAFSKIRVVASVEPGPMVSRLARLLIVTLTLTEGNETIGRILTMGSLDSFQFLNDGGNTQNHIYDVPGTKLTIDVDGQAQSLIDLFIYGA